MPLYAGILFLMRACRCDTPFNLLRRPGGVLCDLARKSGEFEELLELATKGKALYTNGE